MSIVEVQLQPSAGLGTTGAGDAHAQSIETAPNTFDETLTTGFIGVAVKGGVEHDLLLRYDISGIPRGSTINKARLEWKLAADAVVGGSYRVGVLSQNTIWDSHGFSFVSPSQPNSYSLSFLNPDPSNLAAPHPVRNGTGAIITGVMIFNVFSVGDFAYTTLFEADEPASIVDGYPLGQNAQSGDLTSTIGGLLNSSGRVEIGYVYSSNNIAPDHQMSLYMSDHPTETGCLLVVEYTENFPSFTSVPPEGPIEIGELYIYIPSFNNPVASGTPTTVVFELLAKPTGAQLIFDAVVWVPTRVQGGKSHDFTLRITNIGGLSDEQSWQVEVLPNDEQGCVQAGSSSIPAVGAIGLSRTHVGASAVSGPSVVAMSAAAAAVSAIKSTRSSVSASGKSSPNVSAFASIRPAVSAVGQMCH